MHLSYAACLSNGHIMTVTHIQTKICKNQPLTTQTKTAVQYTKLLCARYLLQTTALLERGLGACKAACYVYAKKYLWSGNLRAPMQFF